MHKANIFQIILHWTLLQRRNLYIKELVSFYSDKDSNLEHFQAFLRETPRLAGKPICWTRGSKHYIGYATTYAAYIGASVASIEAMKDAGFLVDTDTLRAYAWNIDPLIPSDEIGQMIELLPTSRLRIHYEATHLGSMTGLVSGTTRQKRL